MPPSGSHPGFAEQGSVILTLHSLSPSLEAHSPLSSLGPVSWLCCCLGLRPSRLGSIPLGFCCLHALSHNSPRSLGHCWGAFLCHKLQPSESPIEWLLGGLPVVFGAQSRTTVQCENNASCPHPGRAQDVPVVDLTCGPLLPAIFLDACLQLVFPTAPVCTDPPPGPTPQQTATWACSTLGLQSTLGDGFAGGQRLWTNNWFYLGKKTCL